MRFEFVRLADAAELPQSAPGYLDVALLDMNHSALNLGHDAIVETARGIAAELPAGTVHTMRLFSFDVRRRMVLPPLDGRRFPVYIGTGGPGHLDPRRNTGSVEGEILEDPAWEQPLFELFDAIYADPDRVLIGVCHTFGLLCRWAGIAQPLLRGDEKGGKSAGVRRNVLTDAARTHPWFSQLARRYPTGPLPVVDSRFYDLIPDGERFPGRAEPIGYEWLEGHATEAVTMVEFARQGDLPRIFAVNHHPEVGAASSQRLILERKLQSGEVTEDWHASRTELVGALESDDHDEAARLDVCYFTFSGLLRAHFERLASGVADGRKVPAAL